MVTIKFAVVSISLGHALNPTIAKSEGFEPCVGSQGMGPGSALEPALSK